MMLMPLSPLPAADDAYAADIFDATPSFFDFISLISLRHFRCRFTIFFLPFCFSLMLRRFRHDFLITIFRFAFRH